MMNSLVKNSFLVIMGSTVAMLLFFIFFGVDTSYLGTGLKWKGVIWASSEAIEDSISKYYYEYCFLPTVHSNDGLDVASLNGSFEGTGYNNTIGLPTSYNALSNIYQTGTKLDTLIDKDYIKFDSDSNKGVLSTWSTGWN